MTQDFANDLIERAKKHLQKEIKIKVKDSHGKYIEKIYRFTDMASTSFRIMLKNERASVNVYAKLEESSRKHIIIPLQKVVLYFENTKKTKK